MSLSSVAVEQRAKEAKTLNSFLAFSLIGSLGLHIGVLSLGLGKYWSQSPALENEPIEIAIVELPTPEKLEVTPTAKGTDNNGGVLGNSGGSGGFGVASGGGASSNNSGGSGVAIKNVPRKIASASSIATSKVAEVSPAPQKLSQSISTRSPNQNIKLEKVPTKIVTQPKPVETPNKTIPSEIVTQPKPVIAASPSPVAKTSNLPTSDRSQVQQLTNQRLNRVLTNARNTREASKVNDSKKITAQQSLIAANLKNQSQSGTETSNSLGNSPRNELRNSVTGSTNSTGIGTETVTGTNNFGTGTGTGTGNGTGTSTGRGTGNGTGRGTGNGTGNGTGTGTGRGTGINNRSPNSSTVATGARNVERGTSPGESNSDPNTGSSGKLACRTCSKPKYPESARKRKLEGKAEISVDVDRQGNVTNVRLARTSGHAELDKAAVEQARNWKFNTPNGAAQGVTAKVDFAIEGSERSRQNRERRRQRAATRKKSVASSANRRSPTNPEATTPVRQNTNTALRRSLRRQSTAARRRVDTLPPRQAADRPQRRQSTSQVRLRNSLRRAQSSSPSQTTIRRSQPRTSAPSQSKLRESLRQFRQSQSTPNEP